MSEPPTPPAPDAPALVEPTGWSDVPAPVRGKRALRAWARGVRDATLPAERERRDRCIAKRVLGLDAWRQATLVLAYLSFGSEVETRGLVRAAWDEGRRVAVPRCVAGVRRMEWVEIRSLEGLVPGAFGIEEPPAAWPALGEGEALAPDVLSLVPGLVFDRAGMRLGYGGGYYDRFLGSFAGTSVGLCPGALLVRSLAEKGVADGHDLPVDIVVSERGVCRPQRGGAA